jgi:hypothetical protein
MPHKMPQSQFMKRASSKEDSNKQLINMKQDKTLLKIVQKLQRKELIRYASNLGMECDETWDISKLRKAYTEFVLSHPKELLLMLPKADLDIIRKAKDSKAGEGVDRVNDHLTPIMVLYGLADIV